VLAGHTLSSPPPHPPSPPLRHIHQQGLSLASLKTPLLFPPVLLLVFPPLFLLRKVNYKVFFPIIHFFFFPLSIPPSGFPPYLLSWSIDFFCYVLFPNIFLVGTGCGGPFTFSYSAGPLSAPLSRLNSVPPCLAFPLAAQVFSLPLCSFL